MSRTISSSGTVGITLTSPGDNPVLVTSSGTIDTPGSYAIYGTAAAAWTITNDGSLSAAFEGIRLADGGTVTNGSAADTGASIYGGYAGVDIEGAPGKVTNFGTIMSPTGNGSGTGVTLGDGGTVVNGSAADTTADMYGFRNGVYIVGSGTVTNFGTMGNYVAVSITGAGMVTNSGQITGSVFTGGGAVTNTGTIDGYKGLEMMDGGTVTNSGLIEGRSADGILISGAGGTVTNAGTIDGASGTALLFTTGNDTLIVHPGAVFVGGVTASSTGSNILDLAGGSGSTSGTISGVGSKFLHFGTLLVEKGVQWSLAGSNTLAAGSTVAFGHAGQLVVTGSLQVASQLNLSGQGSLGPSTLNGSGVNGTIEIGTAGGAVAGKTNVDAGATLSGNGRVQGGIVDNGRIVATGGKLILPGNVSGTGTISISASAVLDAGGRLAPAVQFLAGAAEFLQLGDPAGVSSVISGFGAADRIDLLGQIATGLSYVSATGILTVSGSGGTIASLHFSGSYTTGDFALATDHHDGTFIKAH